MNKRRNKNGDVVVKPTTIKVRKQCANRNPHSNINSYRDTLSAQ